MASKGSNLLIVRALISCGSKIGVQNNTKESPLSISKLSPNDEIKQYFIDLSQKKILRDSLDELISQYMPSLNQEEEEDSDGPNRPSQYETPSLPIKVRNQAISKKGKDSLLYDSIYKELKDIDKRITKVMESSHIHQIHSREFQDQSSISTQEENDNMFKTLNRYSNTLSGKIHSLAYELDIDHNEEEETHDDKASTEKASTGKEEQPIENQPFQKPLSQFLYFSGKTHCYFCGAAQYHLCSTCKCHVCPICEFSSIHERKHH